MRGRSQSPKILVFYNLMSFCHWLVRPQSQPISLSSFDLLCRNTFGSWYLRRQSNYIINFPSFCQDNIQCCTTWACPYKHEFLYSTASMFYKALLYACVNQRQSAMYLTFFRLWFLSFEIILTVFSVSSEPSDTTVAFCLLMMQYANAIRLSLKWWELKYFHPDSLLHLAIY